MWSGAHTGLDALTTRVSNATSTSAIPAPEMQTLRQLCCSVYNRNRNKEKREGDYVRACVRAVIYFRLLCFLSFQRIPRVYITYLFTPWRWIFFKNLIVTQLVKQQFAFSMEPKGSLPCSQKPTTRPCPELAESSLPHRSLSPQSPS
jgi:hypothetical protein